MVCLNHDRSYHSIYLIILPDTGGKQLNSRAHSLRILDVGICNLGNSFCINIFKVHLHTKSKGPQKNVWCVYKSPNISRHMAVCRECLPNLGLALELNGWSSLRVVQIRYIILWKRGMIFKMKLSKHAHRFQSHPEQAPTKLQNSIASMRSLGSSCADGQSTSSTSNFSAFWPSLSRTCLLLSQSLRVWSKGMLS